MDSLILQASSFPIHRENAFLAKEYFPGASTTRPVLYSNHFSTNFHPDDCGILDTIAQALLPGLTDPSIHPDEHLGITAELLLLSMTRRGGDRITVRGGQAAHFGVLVVCLPHLHESKIPLL